MIANLYKLNLCDSRGKRKGKKEEKKNKRRMGTGRTDAGTGITFVPGWETTRYNFSYLYRVSRPVQMRSPTLILLENLYRFNNRYK
jgi:hypothetical protein